MPLGIYERAAKASDGTLHDGSVSEPVATGGASAARSVAVARSIAKCRFGTPPLYGRSSLKGNALCPTPLMGIDGMDSIDLDLIERSDPIESAATTKTGSQAARPEKSGPGQNRLAVASCAGRLRFAFRHCSSAGRATVSTNPGTGSSPRFWGFLWAQQLKSGLRHRSRSQAFET